MKVTACFYRPSDTPGNDVYYLEVDNAARTHYHAKRGMLVIGVRRTSVCRVYKIVYPKHGGAPEYVDFDINMFDNIRIVSRSVARVQMNVTDVQSIDFYHTDFNY